MFKIESFREGVAIRVKQARGERHAYTEMCHGLAMAMRDNGREVEPMDLSRRWHEPLAGSELEDVEAPDADRPFRPSMLRQVIACAEAIARRGAMHGEMPYEVRKIVERDQRYDGSYVVERAAKLAAYALDEGWITREAAAMVDAEIKRAHPKCRRGTKQYKARFESVEDRARGIVRERKVSEACRAALEMEAWLGSEGENGFARKRRDVCGYARYLRTVADDVEALGSDTSAIGALRERAAEVERLWIEYEAGILARVSQVKANIERAWEMLLVNQ